MSEPQTGLTPARMAGVLGQVAFVILAAVLVYSFVAVTRDGELRRRCSAMCLLRPSYAGADRAAPKFTLKDAKGEPVSLESFQGKVVVLNFWSTTCRPCLEEMPELAELSRILRERKDTALLTVSIDESQDDVMATLKAVLREEPPFPVLFDPTSSVVGGKYGTKLFPETWILDKKGIIRARFDGARSWSNAAVVELIDQLRAGGYCPVDINAGRMSGQAAKLCDELGGG